MAATPRPSLVVALASAFVVALGQAIAVHADRGTEPDVTPAAERSPSLPLADDAASALGQPFQLGLGETARVDGDISVTFRAVMEDSRCPADVQCVWEGNAQVTVDIATRGHDQVTLSLDTNPGFATEGTHEAYTIRLVDLEPYPRTDAPGDAPYRLTLRVDPADDQSTGSRR